MPLKLMGRHGGVLEPPFETPQGAIPPPPPNQQPLKAFPLLSSFLASLSNGATFKFCSAPAAVCWAVSPGEDFCPEAGLARTLLKGQGSQVDPWEVGQNPILVHQPRWLAEA